MCGNFPNSFLALIGAVTVLYWLARFIIELRKPVAPSIFVRSNWMRK